MAERRLPFTVKDDEGSSHQGEVLIVASWRPDLEINAAAAFTVVLPQQPIETEMSPPGAPNVVVCAPTAPVRLPTAAVGEAAAPYGAEAAPPLRLSRRASDAFAAGALLAAQPLSIDLREVFGAKGTHPRLDLLARELLAVSRRDEACWRVLDETLCLPHPRARVVRPERVRARLRGALLQIARTQHEPTAAEAVARLGAIAAAAAPEAVVASLAELKEDVALVRCLAEHPEEASELAAMRAYVDGAKPNPQMRVLLVDHAVTREQLSFVALLSEPRELDRMRGTFEMFQGAYVASYVEHHQRYWQAFARLRSALDEAAPTAEALARLNTLRALGRPMGGAALAAYERLTRRQQGCAAQNLESALRERPTCPACGISLEASAPSGEAEEVMRRLHGALARQQARLASEAVRRILARGGERIEQFLQIVQASDLAGLAQVLDDELLAFLRELLSEPTAPTPEALDLFEQLTRSYPLVREEQVEAVIGTLRQLLTERLAEQQAVDPSQPAAIRLASTPPAP